MVFHGSLGHEQGLRDLPVRLPGCGELRDPQLARCQCVAPAQGITAWPHTGGHELLASPVGERETAERVGEIQALGERSRAMAREPPRRCALPRSVSARASSSGAAEERSTVTASVSSSMPRPVPSTTPAAAEAIPIARAAPHASPARPPQRRAGRLAPGRRVR